MKEKPFDGFDLLAPFYDSLALCVYGRSMVKAQVCFLHYISPASRVLIIGGGTGWLLAELLRIRPECEVWYVEPSANMLTRAKQRNKSHSVHFVQGTEDDISAAEFDFVIAHFFLDLFPPAALSSMIHKMHLKSKPSVRWLVADFVDGGKWWQKGLLRLMYLFFGWMCHIKANELPDWSNILPSFGLKKIDNQSFYGGFIESAIYELNMPLMGELGEA